MKRRDRGSALVMVVIVSVAFTAAGGAALAALSRDLIDASRARSAADAAALASVEGGPAAAIELADGQRGDARELGASGLGRRGRGPRRRRRRTRTRDECPMTGAYTRPGESERTPGGGGG